MTTSTDRIDMSIFSHDEMQAEKYVKRGEIDHALSIYQRLEFNSSRILNIIGVLYIDKKSDYDSGIKYFKRALEIQEKNGDDISNTLTALGSVYEYRKKFDLALVYHSRALSIRKMAYYVDQRLVASSLIGKANAHWGQRNLSKALHYAQQALTFNESVESGNDLNLALNLATLANIHHSSGDDCRALEVATRALILLESCVSADSRELASLLNNIGVIQLGVDLFSDAQQSFIRAMIIYEKTLPEEHPKRVATKNIIQQISKMQPYNNADSYSHLLKFLSRILFFMKY